jgi:hypothetical protein
MGILARQAAARFKNSHRVFTHSFDSATGWKSADNSIREIEWESQRLLIQPPKTPIRGRQRNLLTRGRRRLTQTLVAAILASSVGVIAVTLMLGIHPALDKVTLRKDAAALVSSETQSRTETSPPIAQGRPSPVADNAGIKLVAAQPADLSEPEAPKSSLIANPTSSPEQKRNSDSSAPKKLRASRREPEGRLDRVRNPQIRREVALTQQPYEQKGPSSFLTGISRALGFSRN